MVEVGVVAGVVGAAGAMVVGEVGIKKEEAKDWNNQGKPLSSLQVLRRGRVGVQPPK
jgi:hypothetical protein